MCQHSRSRICLRCCLLWCLWLVLETDCPFLAPEPHRRERNDSRFLPLVVKKLAEIKGISEEEVIRVTEENAKRLYRME